MTGTPALYIRPDDINSLKFQVIEEAADHEEIEDGEAVSTPGDKIDFLFF